MFLLTFKAKTLKKDFSKEIVNNKFIINKPSKTSGIVLSYLHFINTVYHASINTITKLKFRNLIKIFINLI